MTNQQSIERHRMMSDHNKQSEAERHQAIWELIPWYVNDTLEEPEHGTVAHHIAECQTCQEEIARCRTIAALVRASDVAAWSPSPERVARMMARIDGESHVSNRENRWIAIRESFEKIRLAFQETPSSFRWALAAQTTVIILLAAAVILQSSVSPSLLYRTLSDAGNGPEPGRAHIQVVFAEDITEGEIRTLLSTLGATIVAGPSTMAVYTVAVAADDREAPARMRETLAVLRAHPKVRIAETKEP
jgi:anti-sigma factor RsiW